MMTVCTSTGGLGAGILGVELDPKNPNKFLTEPKVLILFNPENWWERMGANNEGWQTGCIEGSWMYKRNGKYYLTYSCCGTEYYTYTMGAYVSDKPLDGFKLQEKNPISRSRDGFIKGGGHGSIVNGPNDTIWCFYTIPVCIDHTLERRIGIDPCGIDEDGNLYAITGCELPQYAPGVLAHPEKGNATDVDVLTVFKPSKASSYAPGHKPFYALDETMHTWWQPADNDQEPELAVSLSGSYYLSAVRLMWKDVGLDFDKGIYPGPYQYVVECAESLASDEWKVIVDAADNKEDLAVDYRTFEPVRAAKVRIRILGWQEGIQPGIINFTVFGQSSVKATGEYYKFG
jgi:xylan 1,4-beta-xylosidase